MKVGIGLKIPFEPVLLDAGPLPPGSWDMITETGFGPSSNFKWSGWYIKNRSILK